MTTKIKYKFINGEILEVEVDDIIAAFIFKDRTREASANRKERRYNFSLEAALYEDEKFYADYKSIYQFIFCRICLFFSKNFVLLMRILK